MPNKLTIARYLKNRFKEVRLGRGIPREKAARDMGYDQSTLWAIETQRTQVSLEFLKKAKAYYGLTSAISDYLYMDFEGLTNNILDNSLRVE